MAIPSTKALTNHCAKYTNTKPVFGERYKPIRHGLNGFSQMNTDLKTM